MVRIYVRLFGGINENEQEKQRLISEKTLSQTLTNAAIVAEPDLIPFDIK